jgi:uncharacterized protein (TIGR03083 family)
MTNSVIQALTVEHQRAVDLIGSLTADEWQTPSGCTGWRVQDVIQHMASTFHTIADPASIDGGSSEHAEENAEVPVQARRDWTTAEVAAEYHEWAAKGIEALTALQEPPMAEMVAPLADLGSHPLRLLANAIVFDHYCHLRHDIGAAIPRAAALPHDPLALDATVEWMLAGLPQMCATALAGCTQGVNLSFDSNSSYALRPGNAGEVWTVSAGADSSLPTAATTAHDFVSWGTKRTDWRHCGVKISDAAAAATLDAINVI